MRMKLSTDCSKFGALGGPRPSKLGELELRHEWVMVPLLSFVLRCAPPYAKMDSICPDYKTRFGHGRQLQKRYTSAKLYASAAEHCDVANSSPKRFGQQATAHITTSVLASLQAVRCHCPSESSLEPKHARLPINVRNGPGCRWLRCNLLRK